jgi:glutamate 5-kinase
MTNTFNALLNLGAIPVINENDTVAVHELKFGDNDSLSSVVAGIVGADLLILLSDVDGFYSKNPRTNPDAVLLPEVREVTAEMEANSMERGTTFSTGGMITKLHAAKRCMAVGIPMVITSSEEPDVIRRIVSGEKMGTVFIPKQEKMHTHKKWIGFGRVPQGVITVDRRCEDALIKQGESLLPSEVIGCTGDFDYGAVISIVSADEREIARGITNYSCAELTRIKGKQAGEVEEILGHKDYEEVVHRDNLYVM